MPLRFVETCAVESIRSLKRLNEMLPTFPKFFSHCGSNSIKAIPTNIHQVTVCENHRSENHRIEN